MIGKLMSSPQNLQSPGDVLDAIADLAPKIVIVRTDDVHVGEHHRRNVQFDRLGSREVYDLRVRGDDRVRAINRLQSFAAIRKDQAEEIWSLSQQLQAINPVGTWALEVEPEREVPTITPHNCLDFGLALKSSYQALVDALHEIDRVEVDQVNEGSAKGFVRRRTFLRLLTAGHERCALDTAHLGATSEAIVLKSGEYLDQNLERADRWCTQLGCTPDQLSVAFKELRYLVGDLSLRTLVLREAAT